MQNRFWRTRVRVLNATQRGAAHAINAGIAAGRADLLAVMDADEYSLPDRLMTQLAYMREHPDTVLLGARFSFLIGKNLVPVAPPLMYHRQIRKALLQGDRRIFQRQYYVPRSRREEGRRPSPEWTRPRL